MVHESPNWIGVGSTRYGPLKFPRVMLIRLKFDALGFDVENSYQYGVLSTVSRVFQMEAGVDSACV